MSDDTILFATGSGGPIHRVKATGGSVSVVSAASARTLPFPIPNKDRFLFYNKNNRTVEMATLSGDGKTTPLFTSDSMAVFAPAYGASPAYVLWLQGTTLVAQPFDADHGTLSRGRLLQSPMMSASLTAGASWISPYLRMGCFSTDPATL